MRRPNPRQLRRALWLVNAALAALVLAVLAPLLFAEAAAPRGEGPALREAWERTRRSGLRWTPPLPVSDSERRSVLGKYESHPLPHWPFVGPLPPEPEAAQPPADPKDTAPEGLATLGRIELVVIGSTQRAISFVFHVPAGRTRAFAPGEIIRARASDPARFRLLAIEEPQKQLYHVHYEVLSDGAAINDRVLIQDERLPPITRIGSSAAPRPAEATAPAPGTGTAASAQPARAIDPAQPSAPSTLEALRPRRHVNPRNPRDRVLELDAAAYAWSRGRGVKALVAQAKTQVAKDPSTGKTLGLRLTGFEPGVRPERLDVRRGDILVSIAGQPVSTRADIARIASTLDPTKLVPVVIDRRGTLYTYRIDARDPRNKRPIRYFDL